MIYELDTDRVYVHNGSIWKYVAGGTDPIGCRVYRNSAFTLTVAGAPIVAFDTEVYDYGNNHDTATGRYTCPETAQYRVDARSSVNGAVAGERFICGIYKNAAEDFRGTDFHGATTGRITQEVHGVTSCTAGDILDFRINQVNGTARGLDVGSGGILTYMMVSRA